MPKVHVLAPDIISKIAAGEVVDRPSSVIKELLENALDAQADTIEIELTQAGKTSIRVKDNGCGIDEGDIETVFKRHSTSKIQTADDLFDIHSLGFRGEALYSIAAVSDITLRSKTEHADNGWEIHLRGGEKLKLKPAAMPDGTEIEVKELFFNTPARRKFLRSDASEVSQILNIVIPYTLLYPGRRFKLVHAGKTLLDLSPSNDHLNRITDVLNLNKDFIIQTERSFETTNLTARLFLSDINILRSKRDLQFLFINGRPVQSKNISFHLNDVYRLILPPRHYPFFCAFLTLPANTLDVNIHPTKREVKVKDEQAVCSSLRKMCEAALMQASRPKQAVDLPLDNSSFSSAGSNIRGLIDEAMRRREDLENVIDRSFDIQPFSSAEQPATEQYTFPQHLPGSDWANAFEHKNQSLKAKLENAHFIGTLLNKYLLFESASSLLLTDQHAAQERIMFEQFITQMQKGRVEVQSLLTPYLLKSSPQELLAWQDAQETLETIGFSTSQFDNETIAIHAHPALVKDPESAVRELLAGDNPARCDHETIARRACRSSIMAGDILKPQQAEFQREQLLNCKDPFTCPHGRPTVVEMSLDFLDKQFLRT
ncbi:MAG TPA: DNA mismatch repair endonuclease MutL [Candidatus Omnitrophota bacterium]|nr:DNA mismatch repair endonuclease MutL [Candidatus Omnitrophota bacterium]HSA30190.1 DNA mismatch repair endonuclease MutL [Candidatus Omnitrophota bacterium]